jgi:NADH-quinone oxidoreductase subunit H
MSLEIFIEVVIRLVVALVITLGVIVGSALLLSYADRKVMGLMQDRLGPYHTGKWGLLQAVADMLKLVLKEDIVPAKAERALHLVAPIIFVMPMIAAFVVLPLGDGLVAADLNIGLVYIAAMGSLAVVGILAAGWSSNSKYSTLGALRSVAQAISYEVPFVLSLVPPAMLAGTLSLSGVVRAQENIWNVLVLPLGLLVFFICGLAETNRNPFDLPEAESELTAGYLTEYSGVRWAMFFMAEYGNMVVICAVAAVLFLGGWHGPVLPGVVWMLGKTYALIFMFLWIRATLPRLRIDQLMSFAWKVLIPLALVNIGLTGVMAVLLPNAYHIPLGVLNWLLVIGFIVGLPRLLRRGWSRSAQPTAGIVRVKTGGPVAGAVGR